MTMIVSGILLKKALDAALILKGQGIGVRVLDMATIKPLDTAFIAAQAAACGAALTVEEHSIIGGLGSAVAETLAETTPVPFGRVGVEDQFGQSGSPAVLLRAYGLTAENIASRAKGVIAKKK